MALLRCGHSADKGRVYLMARRHLQAALPHTTRMLSLENVKRKKGESDKDAIKRWLEKVVKAAKGVRGPVSVARLVCYSSTNVAGRFENDRRGAKTGWAQCVVSTYSAYHSAALSYRHFAAGCSTSQDC